MKLARQPDGGRPVASLDGGPFFVEVGVDPTESRGVGPAGQLRDHAGLEHAMGKVRPGDLLNSRLRHEDAALRDRLQTTLGDQPVKHLSNALAGDMKDRRQPMLRQFRSRRQPALEKRARQGLVEPPFDRGAVNLRSFPGSRSSQGFNSLAQIVHIMGITCAHPLPWALLHRISRYYAKCAHSAWRLLCLAEASRG